MKKYKGMYIIRPDLTEEKTKATIADVNAIFTDKGCENLEVEEWGVKELAYEINDFKKGYYVVFTVDANNEAVAEYDRIANIKEELIRHIIVRD